MKMTVKKVSLINFPNPTKDTSVYLGPILFVCARCVVMEGEPIKDMKNIYFAPPDPPASPPPPRPLRPFEATINSKP